jgi:hypothetical protein
MSSLKIAGAIFVGGFVGALVAAEFAIVYCWIGFLLGGAVSCLVFCRGEIYTTCMRYLTDTLERLEIEVLPSITRFFLLAGITGLVSLSWIFIPFILHPESEKSLLSFVVLLSVANSVFVLGMDIACKIFAKDEKSFLDPFVLRMLFKCNLVFMVGNIIWYGCKWTPDILALTKEIFYLLHTKEALLCGTYGCAGSILGFVTAKLTGVHFGGALLGALCGVAVGLMDYRILWPKLLALHSPKLAS